MESWLPWVRLHLTPGLGRAAIFRLIDLFGDPETALAQTGRWHTINGLRRDLVCRIPEPADPRLIKACRQIQDRDARILTFWDQDYPPLLKTISDPPSILYVRGILNPSGRRLAIVGSRKPTPVGLQWTRQIAAELATHGITIVSGLARGIDAAAHQGSLDAAGETIAVLGCGIDQIYPPEHGKLMDEITCQGAVLSEYPPGTEPLPGHFPGRNRIISGLCQGVLVVEANSGSGSLITTEFALEQGREVMAVPGGIDRPTSTGTNLLIKQGAHPVTEVSDILAVLWSDCVGVNAVPVPGAPEALDPLPEPASKILQLLDGEPKNVDELAMKSGLTPMELSAILLHLELLGRAETVPGARYIRGSKARHHP